MEPNPGAHALSSYVPVLLHERLAGGAPLLEPEVRLTPAAVLLSDIQGFTPLVEAFSRSGRDGLEELTWRLNGYFADLAEVVYGHGGDVLSVAGDAFLCCWPVASKELLDEAVLRAAQASKAIQERLHGRDVGRGLSFATRIGIGAGELCVGFVGGVGGRWELIAAGPALRDAADAEKVSAAGRVVLSRDAWKLVASRCDATGLADGGGVLNAVRDTLAPAPLPPRGATEDTERLLRPCVPPSVLDRLASGLDWLAEQRTVTVLMADLPEIGDPLAASLARVHASVRAFQQVIERFEGTIKLDVDDKGTMVLAVFGLPPRAHENDAVRAAHAAWALREALDTLGVRCGIGIATGRAFCGAFGSDLRREYMLRGDVINLAARLMRAAGAEVLCEHATMQASRGRIRFEALGALQLKGHSAPVQAYRPVAAGARAERVATPIVGRSRERALLAAQVVSLKAGGTGGVALIEADAGLGKSRLLEEAAGLAENSGVRVLIAVADAIESNTAYYAWRPVFAALFGLDAQTQGAAAQQRVLEKMASQPDLVRLVPLLSVVLAVQIPDNELTAEMTGDVRATNTRQLLARVLGEEAKTMPTLLAVEDAHWLDSSSWALLAEVVQSVRPLLGIVTLRPMAETAPPEAARLAELAGDLVLRLEGLSPQDTEALVRQRLGVDQVPQAILDLVQERVAGHPFFCEELVQAMLEAGAIRIVDGACSAGDLEAPDLPTSIEGVILSRLDRLTPGQQFCLKIASVIGRLFSQRTVRETHPEPAERERVPAHLAALTVLGLTIPEALGLDPWYLFKHVITRDVTYQLMPQVQRRPLHRAIAEWYERSYAENLEPHYALLAFHWERAADRTRTVGYLERAGNQAVRGGAFAAALKFFSQAIELGGDGRTTVGDERRPFWEKGLGVAHYFLGDLQKSRVHLERAVALLDQPVPHRAAAGAMLAAALTQAMHRLAPSRYLGRRKADKSALDDAADCYRALAQIYYLDGDPAPRLAYVTLRGVNVGEKAGPSPALARNLSNLGTLCGFMGIPAWGRWYARRAVEMSEREGQYAAAAYVWSINSLGEAQQGNWKAAKAANLEALRRVQELADYNVEAEAWVIRSTILICEGDFDSAPEAWSRARALAERNGNAQILCWSLLDEVDTLLGRDEVEAADHVLERALAVPTAASDGSSTIDKQHAIAMTRLAQRRYDEAVQAADTVLDMVTRQPPTGYHWVDFCASAVEVHLRVLADGGGYARANRARLEGSAARGCKALRKLSRIFGNVRPRAWLLQGMLQRHHGSLQQALRSLARAEAIAQAMDMPFERARALLETGRSSGAGEREACFSAATEIFSRLGARVYVRAVEAARVERA